MKRDRTCLMPQHFTHVLIECYLPGKLIRDPVPRIFIRSWSQRYSLPNTKFQTPEGVQHKQHCWCEQFRYSEPFLLVVLTCSVVSDSLWPHGLGPSRILCPWDSPGKNTGAGCHSLFQGIFPTWGSNPDLLHCRWILYLLSHWGSPFLLVRVEEIFPKFKFPGISQGPSL